MAANKKNETGNAASEEAPKVAATPTEQGVFCKTCERNHPKNFDGPGIGHWKFETNTDAENQFNFYCNQPLFKLFIPLAPEEKFGSLATPQVNGLKVGIYKGAYVDVPKSLAEIVMDSLNQTQRLTYAVTAKNPNTGNIQPARLDLRTESDKSALDA